MQAVDAMEDTMSDIITMGIAVDIIPTIAGFLCPAVYGDTNVRAKSVFGCGYIRLFSSSL